jgi:hypothetical protein
VFLPGEYAVAPPWHSQDGSLGKIGSELPPVEAYDDLFVFRDAAQRWLKSSRPRDAHNVHPVQTHGGRLTFDRRTWFGRPPELRTAKRGVRWYVHCYVHAKSPAQEDVISVAADVLDGIQVGGGRNYGFGVLSLVDTHVVELDDLSFDRLEESDEHVIELVSPYVVASEFPGADDQSVPWWWDTTPEGPAGRRVRGTETMSGDDAGASLRQRREQLAADGETYALDVIDHGQLVGYAGDDVVGTARNSVLRVGTHSRYGYGEFRVRPASDDRVPDRERATRTRANTGPQTD